MGRTHLAAGVAAGLAAVMPGTPADLLLCALGGAAGGILCDVECREKKKKDDALLARAGLVLLIALAFFLDHALHLGLARYLTTEHASRSAFGGLVILLTCVRGRFSAHRTFTHSFLYAALLAFGGWQVAPVLGKALLAGCLSHLVLDLMNKSPLRLFYPLRRGFCLGLFPADRTANRVLGMLALGADLLLLSYCLAPMWRPA